MTVLWLVGCTWISDVAVGEKVGVGGPGDSGRVDGDGDTDGDSDADGDTDSDVDRVAVSVYQIQHDGIAGTVWLEGVVTTSGLTADHLSFFVQDQGGGPWAGVQVYLLGVEASVVAGEVYDITGLVDEYYGETQILVSDAVDLVRNGSASPVAEELDRDPGDWAPYEGQLLGLVDLRVTAEPDDYGESTTNYNITLDDCFVSIDESVTVGMTYPVVYGVLRYSYEAYKLCPRTQGDIPR